MLYYKEPELETFMNATSAIVPTLLAAPMNSLSKATWLVKLAVKVWKVRDSENIMFLNLSIAT